MAGYKMLSWGNIQPHEEHVHVLTQYLEAWIGLVNTSCKLHCNSGQSGNFVSILVPCPRY